MIKINLLPELNEILFYIGVREINQARENLNSATELMIDGTERLVEVGLIDHEHRQPLLDVYNRTNRKYH